MFADAGITDIRLPYPVNPANAPRLLALMDRAAISIIVDHPDVARGWSDAMRRAGRTLDVLVKVDVGFHRCGIDPERRSARLHPDGRRRCPACGCAGCSATPATPITRRRRTTCARSRSDEAETLAGPARSARRRRALRSTRSRSARRRRCDSAPARAGVTELRPGNYVYFDRTQVALGAASLDDCALTVLATVVSKHPGRIILDCGSKTLTNDQARGISPAAGYGAVLAGESDALDYAREIDETLTIERLSEEHATVRVTGTTRLEPGDRVRVVPNHSCVVSNLVDVVRLVDGDQVIDTLPVAARGRIQ